jgi:BirA family biotin operon repressor/biotin-[acetyl-CoA-carboxylase] ligase
MHHVHLKECISTQEEVKKALKEAPGDYLISTDLQTGGIGRQGAKWLHFSKALAFSFTLTPNEELTLTPLEIGVLLARFFKPKVLLKWPNDLLDKNKAKVGGILCQIVGKKIVVGVGLNLILDQENKTQQFPYPVSSIFESKEELKENILKDLPYEIVKFIKDNRLNPSTVRDEFMNWCLHKNQNVFIHNTESITEGRFIGIGKLGEALLDKEGTTIKVLTGSLRFN